MKKKFLKFTNLYSEQVITFTGGGRKEDFCVSNVQYLMFSLGLCVNGVWVVTVPTPPPTHPPTLCLSCIQAVKYESILHSQTTNRICDQAYKTMITIYSQNA